MINILVLEDDPKLNQTVCTYLNDSGFKAKGCLNARAAYDELYNHIFYWSHNICFDVSYKNPNKKTYK